MTGRRSVLFAGGGTAGHVFPALSVARELERLAPDLEPVFVGTADRVEGRLVPEAGYRMHHIDVLPLPRRVSPAVVRLPFALHAAVRGCAEMVTAERAVAAVTFGGYVSFPLARASVRTNLPLVIHEQNAVPGLANRFAARWADRIAVTFPGSGDRVGDPEKAVVTGNPVREGILALDQDAQRSPGRAHFGLEQDRLTLLVFGGSQGARSINRAAVASYGRWGGADRVQILHAAGQRLYPESAAAWERARAQGNGPLVRCVDFIDDMSLAYAAADVVVCRAGATSIAELTALGKPSVVVPYPHATRDHQLLNGQALAQAGAGRLIEDEDLTAAALVDAVQPWLDDADAMERVAAAARAFGRRDAATNVARLVLDLVPPSQRGTP